MVGLPQASEQTLLDALNRAQREAVSTTEGPLLVLAGAGTGKTRVITYRIAYLLMKGVPAENILGVTFTNKAAQEMRERVAALTGGRRPKGLTLSTFHALGVRILRAEAETLGLRRNFTIHDQGDQISLLRTILRDIQGPVSTGDARIALSHISLAKNRMASPEDLVEEAADEYEYLIARAYLRYQQALLDVNCVDFDDLILLPVKLLTENDAVRQKYLDRFRYLMVDEYQDTNGAQYKFTHALVGPDRNICVVGDDDQSIYGFRGAEMDKILRFEKDFPGARVVKLEENYRSTASILRLANAVISGNVGRHDKSLRSTMGAGLPVRWVQTPSAEAEVAWVIRQVQELNQRGRRSYEDMAILLRSAIQARPFEEKLRLRQIPYRLIGGQSYFDRKEIRDAIAYLNVVCNPRDDVSLLRVINTPRRGFGSTTLKNLDTFAREQGCPLSDALGMIADGEGKFTARVRAGAKELADAFRVARRQLDEGRATSMVRQLLDDVGYDSALAELYPDPLTLQARKGAVEDFIQSIERWESRRPDEELGAYLAALTLDKSDEKEKDVPRGLTIQTLHSAKGLEYPVVFLVGVEEEYLPHRKSIQDGDRGIEEERRLFYVGITRARGELILTSAVMRRAYGRDHLRKPSRFLTELEDSSLIESSEHRPSKLADADDVSSHLDAFRALRNRQDEAAGRSPRTTTEP